jgi:DNA-binding transcriptional regulator YhcF (GntR family)
MSGAMEDFIMDFGIDPESQIPKYKQVVNYLISSIEKGKLSIGSRIPSINELSEEFYLSRDTVEKAYTYLRQRKIIKSVKGKGYYVSHTPTLNQLNVCLIFNKLSAYKKIIFQSIVQELGPQASVDLYIHHCNPALFKSILHKNLTEYDYFIIMPHFEEMTTDILQTIKRIPESKLIILDKEIPQLADYNCGAVYQNFRLDIFKTLELLTETLSRYKRLVLVFPTDEAYPYPNEIQEGFKLFCQTYDIPFAIVDEFISGKTHYYKKDVFIVIEDSDLVGLIKETKERKWRIGRDIGILSYNETPLKDVLADGITVISTDFKKMGQRTAQMIRKNNFQKVENPFLLIRRKSF